MTIKEIYEKYYIMPNLQLHQMRVAAVAWQIADNIDVSSTHIHPSFKKKEGEGRGFDIPDLITACLLHDMGNIIKFDLTLFPEFLEPQGLEYWQKVKDEFIEKYGNEEHQAIYSIAKEIGISDKAFEILNSIGFSKTIENLKNDDMSSKIACYSDHRVTPKGVVGMEQRIEEGRERFKMNKKIPKEQEEKYIKDFEETKLAMIQLQKQVFDNCKIKPNEITDDSITSYLNKLENFSIND